MGSAFLLRFQEFCTPAECAGSSNAPTTKTATATYVRSEQNDVDAMGGQTTSIPRQKLSAATKTHTRIQKETADVDQRAARPFADSGARSVHADSRLATKTKTKGEHADRSSESKWQTVPIADARTVGATRTVTAIRSEADDNDPGQAVLHVIPRCS